MAAKKLEPVLNLSEAQSALWKKLKAHLEARLADVRVRNDTSLPMEKTQQLRGRIAELKYLVALDEPAPPMEADDIFKD